MGIPSLSPHTGLPFLNRLFNNFAALACNYYYFFANAVLFMTKLITTAGLRNSSLAHLSRRLHICRHPKMASADLIESSCQAPFPERPVFEMEIPQRVRSPLYVLRGPARPLLLIQLCKRLGGGGGSSGRRFSLGLEAHQGRRHFGTIKRLTSSAQ